MFKTFSSYTLCSTWTQICSFLYYHNNRTESCADHQSILLTPVTYDRWTQVISYRLDTKDGVGCRNDYGVFFGPSKCRVYTSHVRQSDTSNIVPAWHKGRLSCWKDYGILFGPSKCRVYTSHIRQSVTSHISYRPDTKDGVSCNDDNCI